jgi:hypothetical protein
MMYLQDSIDQLKSRDGSPVYLGSLSYRQHIRLVCAQPDPMAAALSPK